MPLHSPVRGSLKGENEAHEREFAKFKHFNMGHAAGAEQIQHFWLKKNHSERMFTLVEGMSGMGNLSRAFTKLGFRSLRLDKKYYWWS